jgi:hypothetical protein
MDFPQYFLLSQATRDVVEKSRASTTGVMQEQDPLERWKAALKVEGPEELMRLMTVTHPDHPKSSEASQTVTLSALSFMLLTWPLTVLEQTLPLFFKDVHWGHSPNLLGDASFLEGQRLDTSKPAPQSVNLSTNTILPKDAWSRLADAQDRWMDLPEKSAPPLWAWLRFRLERPLHEEWQGATLYDPLVTIARLFLDAGVSMEGIGTLMEPMLLFPRPHRTSGDVDFNDQGAEALACLVESHAGLGTFINTDAVRQLMPRATRHNPPGKGVDRLLAQIERQRLDQSLPEGGKPAKGMRL